MPPGQPVHRCAICERLRPCKPHWGEWLCYPCAPTLDVTPAADDAVATDGGSDR